MKRIVVTLGVLLCISQVLGASAGQLAFLPTAPLRTNSLMFGPRSQSPQKVPAHMRGYSNDRLQMTSLSYAKGANTLFSANYWYKQDATNCASGTTGNNGQIQCIIDTVDGTRSLKYTYDALYRLSVAQAGPDASPTWKLGFSYDRYGNR